MRPLAVSLEVRPVSRAPSLRPVVATAMRSVDRRPLNCAGRAQGVILAVPRCRSLTGAGRRRQPRSRRAPGLAGLPADIPGGSEGMPHGIAPGKLTFATARRRLNALAAGLRARGSMPIRARSVRTQRTCRKTCGPTVELYSPGCTCAAASMPHRLQGGDRGGWVGLRTPIPSGRAWDRTLGD